MKYQTWIAALALLGATQTASAEYAAFGSLDCVEWVLEKSNSKRHWLNGYMTGISAMNEVLGSKNNPLNRIKSARQLSDWMDNFCKNNPLETVPAAGIKLFIELGEKEKKK